MLDSRFSVQTLADGPGQHPRWSKLPDSRPTRLHDGSYMLHTLCTAKKSLSVRRSRIYG